MGRTTGAVGSVQGSSLGVAVASSGGSSRGGGVSTVGVEGGGNVNVGVDAADLDVFVVLLDGASVPAAEVGDTDGGVGVVVISGVPERKAGEGVGGSGGSHDLLPVVVVGVDTDGIASSGQFVGNGLSELHVGRAGAAPDVGSVFDVEPDSSVEAGRENGLDARDDGVSRGRTAHAGVADEGISVDLGNAGSDGVFVGLGEGGAVVSFDPSFDDDELVTTGLHAAES